MPKAIHNLEFPPFPHIQKNVEIIPFADFKPKGIHISGHDDDDDEVDVSPELDGEGVPTIMLRVTHDLEKTGKKNKKNKSAGSKTRDDGTPKPWFEQWEDSEILMRAERLDPYVPP
ncbi:hypothetical protein DL93DRAFT_2072483 [Clavulina sp. PMI_390]|nr:hypothetical protein DL93DRAFT_2072483 [Clavulina sp. PMI_390]